MVWASTGSTTIPHDPVDFPRLKAWGGRSLWRLYHGVAAVPSPCGNRPYHALRGAQRVRTGMIQSGASHHSSSHVVYRAALLSTPAAGMAPFRPIFEMGSPTGRA
jgi:hypothetical protein